MSKSKITDLNNPVAMEAHEELLKTNAYYKELYERTLVINRQIDGYERERETINSVIEPLRLGAMK